VGVMLDSIQNKDLSGAQQPSSQHTTTKARYAW